jgi:hypothetical protein
MPRIPPHVIRSVFYLYETIEDARAGKNPGGTGFIVEYEGLRNAVYPKGMFYGVTNYHVAVGGGLPVYPVIRLNTLEGGVDIIDLDCGQWEFLPGKYDVAAVPLLLDRNVHSFASISTHLFVERPREEHYGPFREVDVGEDAFMIGLFLDHAGTTTNVPSARFGHVSMLPDESARIVQKSTGYEGVSYVLDMHSRTGFSGSPVFVYRTFGADLANTINGDDATLEFRAANVTQISADSLRARGRIRTSPMFRFLGIHWAQFPEEWELRDKDRAASLEKRKKRHLITDGKYVEGMSGMTCVIPAWQIMELLDTPKIQEHRQRFLNSCAEKRRAAPEPESQTMRQIPIT